MEETRFSEPTVRPSKPNDRAALSFQGVLQLEDELSIVCHGLLRGKELHVICQVLFVGLRLAVVSASMQDTLAGSMSIIHGDVCLALHCASPFPLDVSLAALDMGLERFEWYLCSAKTSRAPNSEADSHIRPELLRYLQCRRFW